MTFTLNPCWPRWIWEPYLFWPKSPIPMRPPVPRGMPTRQVALFVVLRPPAGVREGKPHLKLAGTARL